MVYDSYMMVHDDFHGEYVNLSGFGFLVIGNDEESCDENMINIH